MFMFSVMLAYRMSFYKYTCVCTNLLDFTYLLNLFVVEQYKRTCMFIYTTERLIVTIMLMCTIKNRVFRFNNNLILYLNWILTVPINSI